MTQSQPWILMCPPDYYGIEYEINPWMSRSRGSNLQRAMRQWQALVETLARLGVRISLLEPVQGLPDMVFTANAGLVYRNEFTSSRFRHQVRAGEVAHFEEWFSSADLQIAHLPEETYFEGAGDALFCGATLFGGYRIRSDVRSHQSIAARIGCQSLPLELVDQRFYHLDTCFCPFLEGAALWFPAAFDSYGQQVIRQYVADLIEVPPEEAMNFGCNAVVMRDSVVVPAGCPRLRRELESRSFCVLELELDEFLKAGGSAKCLTIRVDGEDAASWKSEAQPVPGGFAD